jgi:hypothetical protein
MYKCANAQTCKYTNVQMCNASKAGCQQRGVPHPARAHAGVPQYASYYFVKLGTPEGRKKGERLGGPKGGRRMEGWGMDRRKGRGTEGHFSTNNTVRPIIPVPHISTARTRSVIHISTVRTGSNGTKYRVQQERFQWEILIQ